MGNLFPDPARLHSQKITDISLMIQLTTLAPKITTNKPSPAWTKKIPNLKKHYKKSTLSLNNCSFHREIEKKKYFLFPEKSLIWANYLLKEKKNFDQRMICCESKIKLSLIKATNSIICIIPSQRCRDKFLSSSLSWTKGTKK